MNVQKNPDDHIYLPRKKSPFRMCKRIRAKKKKILDWSGLYYLRVSRERRWKILDMRKQMRENAKHQRMNIFICPLNLNVCKPRNRAIPHTAPLPTNQQP
jgi:hypothetical protein